MSDEIDYRKVALMVRMEEEIDSLVRRGADELLKIMRARRAEMWYRLTPAERALIARPKEAKP